MNAQAAELMPMEPKPAREPQRVQAITTPSDLLAMAVSQGADLDHLRQLMDLKDRHEATEARKAFHQALAAFKESPPIITNDRTNKQYGSTYSSLANLVNNVNKELSPHGLNARWDIEQGQQIKVTCILAHALGHQESVSLSGPPDDSGAKNKLQQIKSTLTYLKGATFEAVTGVATIPGNLDDDGNAAGKKQKAGDPQRPQDEGTQGPEQTARRKAVHDEAFGRHSESVKFIKERIAADDMKAVAAEWRLIPSKDQIALWLAPTKGGCFTTAERAALHDRLPKAEDAK